MAKGKRSEEVRAGLVVLIALIILVAGLFYVSGGKEQFIPKRVYTVLFRDGGGVSQGHTVYLAGSKAGTVLEVSHTKKVAGDDVIRYVAVKIKIDAEREIPVDSRFTVRKSITNVIEFHIDYGTSPELADSDTELFGQRLATFEEALDEGTKLLADARNVVTHVDEAVVKVHRILDDVDVNSIQAGIHSFLDSLNRSGGKVETLLDSARPKLDRVLDDAVAASDHLKVLMATVREDWGEMEPKVQSALDNVESATQTLRGMLSENREPLKSFVQKLDDAATRIAPVLETVEGLTRDAQETVIEARPQLVGTLRKARDAMTNFAALTEDLKTAPWKLVNKPSDLEVREVSLYNAARLYVDSAAQIQRLVEDLETLRELGLLDDPAAGEAVRKVLDQLELSLEHFDARQKELVELIVQPAK